MAELKKGQVTAVMGPRVNFYAEFSLQDRVQEAKVEPDMKPTKVGGCFQIEDFLSCEAVKPTRRFEAGLSEAGLSEAGLSEAGLSEAD